MVTFVRTYVSHEALESPQLCVEPLHLLCELLLDHLRLLGVLQTESGPERDRTRHGFTHSHGLIV